jgi:hypothetical protein
MNADADPINLERSISQAHSSRWGTLHNNEQGQIVPARRRESFSVSNDSTNAELLRQSYWTGYGSGFSVGLLTALSVVGIAVATKLILDRKL